MALQLFNTLTRKIEPLRRQDPARVKVYTCGPTVYDYGHIGNFRTFVAMDILQRWLATQTEVASVMNITDVDDKMIARSNESGQPLREFADIYIAAFKADMERLRIRPAKHLVRATDCIPAMVAWIERLVAAGAAYEREGSVYFRLASFPEYGKLSGKDMEGLQAGARVDVDEYAKEEARDFALWKAAKPGEPHWPSPWGEGRPGWHIECSVMAETLLGPTLDLHCGGADLVFPHHENEIAQVEPLTHQPFANAWFHVEFLLVNGEKMSKRLGNFYTVRDLVDKGYAPSAIRYLLASVPHRRQLNFTLDGLDQAAAALERLRGFRDRLQRLHPAPELNLELATAVAAADAAFAAALDDDLNTAEALGVVFGLVRQVNTVLDQGAVGAAECDAILVLLARFDQVFAVLEPDAGARKMPAAQVDALLAERRAARVARDFARADAIRQQLDAAGILVEDIKGGGERWRYK